MDFKNIAADCDNLRVDLHAAILPLMIAFLRNYENPVTHAENPHKLLTQASEATLLFIEAGLNEVVPEAMDKVRRPVQAPLVLKARK